MKMYDLHIELAQSLMFNFKNVEEQLGKKVDTFLQKQEEQELNVERITGKFESFELFMHNLEKDNLQMQKFIKEYLPQVDLKFTGKDQVMEDMNLRMNAIIAKTKEYDQKLSAQISPGQLQEVKDQIG